MEKREWIVDKATRRHVVVLQHDPDASFVDVLVNGSSVVLRSERRVDGSTDYRFTVGGEPVSLLVRALSTRNFVYELKSVATPPKPGGPPVTPTIITPHQGARPSDVATSPALTPVALAPALTPHGGTSAAVAMPRAPTPPAMSPAAPERATPLLAPAVELPVAAPTLRPSVKISPLWGIVPLVLAGIIAVVYFVVQKQAEWAPYSDAALGFNVELPPGAVGRNQGLSWFRPQGTLGAAEITKLNSLGATWEIGLIRGEDAFDLEKVRHEAEAELNKSHKVLKVEEAPKGFTVELMTVNGPATLKVHLLGRRLYAVSVRASFAVKSDLRTRFFDSFKPTE